MSEYNISSLFEIHFLSGQGQDLEDVGGLPATGRSQGGGRRGGKGGEREIK